MKYSIWKIFFFSFSLFYKPSNRLYDLNKNHFTQLFKITE